MSRPQLTGPNPVLIVVSLVLLFIAICGSVSAQTDPAKPAPEVAALLKQAIQQEKPVSNAERLRILNEALEKSHHIQDTAGEAYALGFLGITNAADNKFDVAAPLLEKALPFFQTQKIKQMQILILSVLGQVYKELAKPDQALAALQQAVALSGEPAYAQFKTASLLLIGLIYAEREQWTQAIEAFEPAIPSIEQSGTKDQLSVVLGVLSLGYLETGQYLKGMQCSEKVLQIREGVTNKTGEALALTTLAALYVDLGQYSQGREIAEQAMGLWRKLGSDELTIITQLLLAESYRKQEQPQSALDYFLQALPLLRKSAKKNGLGVCLYGIAGSYRNLKKPSMAIPYYEEAARIYHANGDLEEEGEMLNYLGEVHRALENRPRARTYFGQALALFNQALASPAIISNKRIEIAILYYMAEAEEESGQLTEARAHLDQAVKKLELFRTSLGDSSNVKIGFIERMLFGLDRVIALSLKSNQPAEAFAVVQKTKARVLLDLMEGGKVNISQSLKPEEAQREQELRQAADRLNLAMVQESVNNEVGAKKRFAALKEQLTQAEQTLQTYEDSLYVLHPELAGKRAATTVTLEDVGQFLPEDTALLEFVTLYANEYPDINEADTTWLFVVTKKNGKPDLQVFPVSMPKAALAERVEAFRSVCADPRKSYQAQSRQLYDLLIRPAAPILAGKKRLIICPDGPIWGLPFAALSDGKQFLLQRYELAYAYSATGAKAAIEERQRNKPSKTLLALGNPNFGDATRFGDSNEIPGQRPLAAPSRPLAAPSRTTHGPTRPLAAPSRPLAAPSRPLAAPSRALLIPRGGRITMLPGTQREVDKLRTQFPDATILTGAAAQESVVKQTAGEYRYIHLASHAFFNDASPLLSSIVLAQPPPGSKDDGFLTARELFDTNLQADMVVLSACNTARGDKRSGEGIVGLTWALFVAGAPTQVVSQWSVDDASTATLMGVFYTHLAQGKAAALRNAELSLLRDRRYGHPYYWAPFTLMGDWR